MAASSPCFTGLARAGFHFHDLRRADVPQIAARAAGRAVAVAPEAGYSGTPLPRKLGIKPGHEVAVLGGPASVAAILTGLPGVAPPRRDLSGGDPLDVIVFFVTWRADLEEQLATLRGAWPRPPGCGWPGRNGRRGCPRT